MLSGTVFEDQANDLLVSGQTIGDTNNPGVVGATVKLYADGGDGVADGVDDVLMANTTTGVGGVYSFSVGNGTYWTAVDSKTVVSATALMVDSHKQTSGVSRLTVQPVPLVGTASWRRAGALYGGP